MSRSSGGYSSGAERGYSSGAERCGYTSSDGEGLTSEAKSLKRRRFEQHRKQHYNMRAALQTCAFRPLLFCVCLHVNQHLYFQTLKFL